MLCTVIARCLSLQERQPFYNYFYLDNALKQRSPPTWGENTIECSITVWAGLAAMLDFSRSPLTCTVPPLQSLYLYICCRGPSGLPQTARLCQLNRTGGDVSMLTGYQ